MRYSKIKIIIVSGARPNFMKIAPLIREFDKNKSRSNNKFYIEYLFLHTGQHYDFNMMEVFLRDLGIPKPAIDLGVGSGTHATQTAKIMIRFEKICLKYNPDLIIVVGDVNSTIACTLVAAKLKILSAHIEAGLRSYDRTMPEEINRILTDHIADFLFTSSYDANINLLKEGISKNKIFFVGNTMIDSLNYCRKEAYKLDSFNKYSLNKKKYGLVTLHRPSNVDNKKSFCDMMVSIETIAKEIPMIFPMHPRTNILYKKYRNAHKLSSNSKIKLIAPLGYLEFLSLMMNSKFVLTDSGGIQEETTILGIPCLTLRENTERPITISQGTNTLIGQNRNRLFREVKRILMNDESKLFKRPKLWDGHASARIYKILIDKLQSRKQHDY